MDVLEQRKRKRRNSLGLVLITTTGIVALGWATGGWTRGVEWSPDKISHRSFRYYVVVPWLVPDGIRVTPIERREWESPFDSWLKKSGSLKQRAGEPRWYLSKGFAPGVRGWSGPAKSLCKAMGCWGDADDRWIAWSDTHASFAADLWSTVGELARGEPWPGMQAAAALLDSIDDKTTHEEYLAHKKRWLERYRGDLEELERYRKG